jgi:hypothetical protein
LFRCDGENVLIEDHQVSEFAAFQRAFDPFFEGSIGGIQGIGLQRLRYGDLLLGNPAIVILSKTIRML